MTTSQKSGLKTRSRTSAAPRPSATSNRGCGTRVMSAWRCNPGDHPVEQAVGRLAGDLGLRAQEQAMAKGGAQQALYVVRGVVLAGFVGGGGAVRVPDDAL